MSRKVKASIFARIYGISVFLSQLLLLYYNFASKKAKKAKNILNRKVLITNIITTNLLAISISLLYYNFYK